MKKIILFLTIGLFLPFSALAEVRLSAREATKNIFPALEKYDIESRIVDSQEVKISTVFENDGIIGWTVVVNEMGKIKPITFLVGIDKEGKILGIYVLEYRDMFGDQIRRKSFLKQFKGKSIKDAIFIGRDIDAVTGATISSQAATLAVRKSLKIIEELKIGGQVFKESIK